MDSQIVRQRRYRLHKRGDHSECLPDRECRGARKATPIVVEPSNLSPREAMERELSRTIARLDTLHAALAGRPLDIPLLAESRGQQRLLVALGQALGKLAPAAPVVPLAENPLEALRRRREEQGARGGEGAAQHGPAVP